MKLESKCIDGITLIFPGIEIGLEQINKQLVILHIICVNREKGNAKAYPLFFPVD